MGSLRTVLPAAACLTLLLCASCGRDGGATSALSGASADQASLAELEQVLDAELARLGVDPDKAAAAAPSGADSIVFDLEAEITLGNGQDVPDVVALSWTGQLPGDYDQNGEVNASDLAPLALHYGAAVAYREDPPDAKITWWPEGDPADTGGAGPGEPAAPGSGAHNWRLARIDGDHNGEINSGDVTVIAQHWMERASGYRVYRRGAADEEFTLLPNPVDPTSPVTRERPVLAPGLPMRFTLLDTLPGEDAYTYYVAAYDAGTGLEGGPSNLADTYSAYSPEVELAADPTAGLSPLTVEFTADATAVGSPIANYSWDFDGDGEAELSGPGLSTASHTFEKGGSFYVEVEVEDINGKVAAAVVNIRVDKPPVARLTVSPQSGNPPLEVQFDGSDSYALLGEIVAYEWDFDGDGEFEENTGETSTANHVYADEGSFLPALRVTDNLGHSDTAARIVEVNQAPFARFTGTPQVGLPPLTVEFDAATSFDNDGLIVNYEWDFEDDGIVDFDEHPVTAHTYEEYGLFVVSLTVTDNGGLRKTLKKTIYVNKPPVANLRSDQHIGGPYTTFVLDASGSYDEDGEVVQYIFDSNGDGLFTEEPQASPILEITMNRSTYWFPEVAVMDNHGAQTISQSKQIYLSTSSWEVRGTQQVDRFHDLHGMCVADGRLAYLDYVRSDEELRFVRAADDAASSWEDPVVVTDGLLALASLSLIGGYPSVVFQESDGWPGGFAGIFSVTALDPAGLTWSEPELIVEGRTGDTDGWHTTFGYGEVNGRPAFAAVSDQLIDDDRTLGYYYFDYGTGGNTGWSEPKQVHQAPYFFFAGIKLVESAGRPAVFAYVGDHIEWIRAVDADATAWEPPVFLAAGEGSMSIYTQPLNSNGRPVLPLNYEGNFNWMAGTDELGSAFDFVYFTPGEPASYWTRGAVMLNGRPATMVAEFPGNYIHLKWFPAEDQFGLEWSYPRNVIWFPQPVNRRWLRDLYITEYEGKPYAMLECFLTDDYPFELRTFALLTTSNGSAQ